MHELVQSGNGRDPLREEEAGRKCISQKRADGREKLRRGEKNPLLLAGEGKGGG